MYLELMRGNAVFIRKTVVRKLRMTMLKLLQVFEPKLFFKTPHLLWPDFDLNVAAAKQNLEILDF